MLVVTTDQIPGKSFEALGFVKGNIAKTKNIGRDIMAGFRNIAGGESKSYTTLIEESETEALKRMEAEAKKLGADAVVGVRLGSASLASGICEVMAYGTAVKIKK